MDKVLAACFLSLLDRALHQISGGGTWTRALASPRLTAPPRPTNQRSKRATRLDGQRAHTIIRLDRHKRQVGTLLSLYITRLIEEVQSMAREMIQVTRRGTEAQKERQIAGSSRTSS